MGKTERTCIGAGELIALIPMPHFEFKLDVVCVRSLSEERRWGDDNGNNHGTDACLTATKLWH